MSVEEVKGLWNVEKQSLINQENECSIHVDFQDHMNIDSIQQTKQTENSNSPKAINLFNCLTNSILFQKKKRKWFTSQQTLELSQFLKDFPNYHRKIRLALKIPSSSFMRLKAEIDELDANHCFNRRILRWSSPMSRMQELYIKNLVEPPTYPSPSTGFRQTTNNVFRSRLRYSNVKNYLQNKWHYRFKRGLSWVINNKIEMPEYMQLIFWSRILKELHKHKILINIDEWSFTCSVKTMYSWLPSGKSSPILNINWKGRSSVIFGLISNSFWIWWILMGQKPLILFVSS